MQVLIAFLLVALGIIIDAIYSNIKHKAAYQAFKDGYRQAQREEKIRLDAIEDKRFKERFYRTVIEQPQVQTPEINSEKHKAKVIIPESFMENLHNNGRAAMRLK